jgi:hypothetical protein
MNTLPLQNTSLKVQMMLTYYKGRPQLKQRQRSRAVTTEEDVTVQGDAMVKENFDELTKQAEEILTIGEAKSCSHRNLLQINKVILLFHSVWRALENDNEAR